MSGRGVSKRGKGRPRKEGSVIDSSAKILREKNRQAQSIFRARKRATEVASELRISQLEDIVDRMGDTFLTLVNHVIQSNQKQKDLVLAGRLQESIHTFLTLAASSSDPRWDSPDTGNRDDIRQPTPQPAWNPVNERTVEPVTIVEDTSSSQQVSALPIWNAQNSSNLWGLLDQYDSTPSSFPELTGSPTNVLGNGWTKDLPFSYTATLGQVVGHPVAQSMSTLIIQATLYYVYYILLEANDPLCPDTAKDIFRYALKLHSRDELLFNIRWFLGPGQQEAYRLGITGFQTLNAQDNERFPTLSPAVDSDALSDIQTQKRHNRSSLQQSLLNASGVEAYLLHHELRRITQDVLEIDLEQQDNSREAQVETNSTRKPNLINANVFFPAMSQGGSRVTAVPTQRAPTKQTVRFSESTFIRLLATQASHCLAYGPGYRKDPTVAQQFLRAKPKGKSAVVLNVSTLATHMRFPMHGWSGYTGSKLGQARIFEHIRFEHPDVRFINCHPGSIKSDGFAKSGAPEPPTGMTDGKVAGQFFAWLVSDEAEFLSGRFVWAEWDVDELKAKKEQILKGNLLLTTIDGFAQGW
ncbi:hypothetical protein CFAM422_011937 [Trichoderma lentiforme]|uniref:BZIP domain-containing protein n=1 Tax=Trichoderma lentiforme TaxID=1567552 RepID=A0A9P4X5M8_9HYPO|nr:hypothetical protein CFAM422_011937 [Trichoderma lentiforme]